MKLNRKIATVLLGLTLCFSLAAAAQKVIDFSGLPKTGVLLPIPNGYGGMNWGNLHYITEEPNDGTRNVAVPRLPPPLRPCPRQTLPSRFTCSAWRWSA